MPRRDIALAATISAVWGVNFVVIEIGLEAFPPLLFAALRFAVIAVPAVFLVERPGVGAHWVVAVGLCLGAGQFGLLFVGMHEGVPAGLASLVLQLQAVFTIALAMLFLGERPKRIQLAGAAVAFGGLALIGFGRAHVVPLAGLGLVVAASGSWAAGNICTRLAQPRRPLSLLVWSSLVSAPPLAVLSLLIEGSHSDAEALWSIGAKGWLALAYVVVAASIFGFGSWIWLLKKHPASRIAPFTLLVPVVGIAAAWVWRGEQPGLTESVGAAVTLFGLGLTTRAVPGRPGHSPRPNAASTDRSAPVRLNRRP
jgi:O-acetylserine/cysteine efflux transporter